MRSKADCRALARAFGASKVLDQLPGRRVRRVLGDEALGPSERARAIARVAGDRRARDEKIDALGSLPQRLCDDLERLFRASGTVEGDGVDIRIARILGLEPRGERELGGGIRGLVKPHEREAESVV